jgi:hypothetical protein
MRARVAIVSIVAAAVAALFWFRSSASQDPSATRDPVSAPGAARAPITAGTTPNPATPAAASTRELFTARWGGAPSELGRERPMEGNPLGPMSFATDAQGRVHVLDGVNGRIVRRSADGAVESSLPISVTHPEDIAVAADGTTAVLDRHRDKSVALFDASGRPRGKLPLEGEGLTDTGSVTALLIDGSDVYAERAHGPLVLIGNVSGAPAQPRTQIPGRPSRDGLSFLNAGITDAASGRTWVAAIDRKTETHRFTRELRFGAPVRHILLLDSDRAGVIYFAVALDDAVRLECLDRDRGAPLGSAILPTNDLPEESFRDLVVLDGGGVIHAHRTEQGVNYTLYRC